jgi:hypothetical protein
MCAFDWRSDHTCSCVATLINLRVVEADLTQTLESIPLTPTHDSTSNTPSSSHEYSLPDTLASSTHTIDICTHLSEATRTLRRQVLLRFPFLSRYNIDTRDVPFAIDDLRYASDSLYRSLSAYKEGNAITLNTVSRAASRSSLGASCRIPWGRCCRYLTSSTQTRSSVT